MKAQKTRERFQYGAGGPGSVRDQYTEDGFPNSDSSTFSTSVNKSPSEIEGVRPQSLNEEEIQLQIALAMSKEEADEEERRRQRDDVRLQLALSESQTEYHKQKPVTVSSKDELFDVFHQPIVGNGSGGGGSVDPWGNDFVVETTGFDGGGHSGMNGMGERDPWSSPGNGNDGGRMMRPAVSPGWFRGFVETSGMGLVSLMCGIFRFLLYQRLLPMSIGTKLWISGKLSSSTLLAKATILKNDPIIFCEIISTETVGWTSINYDSIVWVHLQSNKINIRSFGYCKFFWKSLSIKKILRPIERNLPLKDH